VDPAHLGPARHYALPQGACLGPFAEEDRPAAKAVSLVELFRFVHD
jgi:hypothetical protein